MKRNGARAVYGGTDLVFLRNHQMNTDGRESAKAIRFLGVM